MSPPLQSRLGGPLAHSAGRPQVPAGASTLTGSFSGPKLVQGTEYAAVINRLGNTELTVGTRVGANGGDDCPNSQLFFARGDDVFQEVFIQDMIVSVLVA